MSQGKTSEWLTKNVKKGQFTRKSIHEKLEEKQISTINKEEVTIGELTGQVDAPETEMIDTPNEENIQTIELPHIESKPPVKSGKKRRKIALT